MQKKRTAPAEVFLNIPYDEKFERLFLAYIAGISAFGLTTRATLEIPSSSRRLEKIRALIDACRYSIHDMSRVELDRRAPRTPRFNMPFELGLAVAHRKNAEPILLQHLFGTLFAGNSSDRNNLRILLQSQARPLLGTLGVDRGTSLACVWNLRRLKILERHLGRTKPPRLHPE